MQSCTLLPSYVICPSGEQIEVVQTLRGQNDNDKYFKNLIKTKYIWEETRSPVKKILVQNWIKSEIKAGLSFLDHG